MAVTQNTYTGDGSTVLFSFTFPYLETTDIKVSLDGSITTAYTLANATTIQFDTAPSNGAAIRIYRVTDDAALAAQFYPGSAIRSQDLNDNFTQNLYVTQESNREAASATVTAEGAVVTANNAVATANSAVSTADIAETNSLSAIDTATTASTTAASAVTTADSAVTTANNAVNTANAANTTATNAESIANSALDIVAGTVQFVPYADAASIPSSPSDGDAIQVVDSTGIESFTPLTGLPTGFVGTPQLFVRLQYDATGVTWTYVGYGANNPDNRYVIQGVTGSATNPSFYFDPNTGIYSPGEDELALSTGGSARLTIDSAGAIDIGSTVTASSFEPDSSTVPTNGLYLPATNSVALSTNGTGRLFVDASGNVGIHTSTPISDLDISSNRSLNTYSFQLATFNGASFENALVIRYDGATQLLGNFQNNPLAFTTNNLERLRITSDGNVAIGTAIPGARLGVIGESGPTPVFQFGTPAGIVASTVYDNSALYTLASAGSVNPIIQYSIGTSSNIPFTFITNNTERARIDSSGRLLVGTSSDSGGALLQVNGDRVRIATAKTPASATDTGTTGEVCWDANYVYVCTATNTWKRSALSTW